MLAGRGFLPKYFDCFGEGELNMDFLLWLFLLLLHAWQGFCHSSYTSYVSINFQHPRNLICAGEALSHSPSFQGSRLSVVQHMAQHCSFTRLPSFIEQLDLLLLIYFQIHIPSRDLHIQNLLFLGRNPARFTPACRPAWDGKNCPGDVSCWKEIKKKK